MTFSPTTLKTVWDVQIRIREIDMTLHPSVKSALGEVRTFTYTQLAGCCDFLDASLQGRFSDEIEVFAKKVVSPIVEECFLAIEKYSFEIQNDSLKFALLDKLKAIQLYPKFNEFKEDRNGVVIEKLERIISQGSFCLYKLNEEEAQYYGGRVNLDDKSFLQAVQVMDEAGYKQEGDVVGSSFDGQGHITTIHPKELAENYETILKAHAEFAAERPSAIFKPVSIKFGFPQTGRLAKAVVITVEAPLIDAYRKSCQLGELFPTAHVSIYTKEIQMLPILKEKNVTFFQYIDKETPYLSRMKRIFQTHMGKKAC